MGTLSTAAVARMEERLPWYRAMSAEDRSWVGLVAQAGIGAFVAWFREPDAPLQVPPDVFGTAPRELVRSVSLGATLEMVRTVIEIVEEQVTALAAPGDEDVLREAVLRYSREVAFAAAHVYAEAAESRGAWDARLETLVLDAVLRGEADESLHSRATALGWGAVDQVAVIAGLTPPVPVQEAVDALRRGARHRGRELLAAVQGDRLVAILGSVTDPLADAAALVERFGDGPVVVGPTVPHLYAAGRSARAALSGLVAVRAWAEAPRPVLADDLLPERVLAGDGPARRALVDRIYRPLVEAGGAAARHGHGVRRVRRARWSRPPARCSCTRTRCATGCAGSPRSPATTPPTRARDSSCGPPWRWAGWPPARLGRTGRALS